MIWLVLWCGSGAIGGWAIGRSRGRPGVGAVLGTFCSVLGWMMLFAGEPKAPVAAPSSDAPPLPVADTAETAETAETADTALAPIVWSAA